MTKSTLRGRLLRETIGLLAAGVVGLSSCGGGDLIEVDLCEGDAFQSICDPPAGPTPPATSWVTGFVYLDSALLLGAEGMVQMFFDSTFSVAYESPVDSASGAWGRQLDQDAVCLRSMFAKARYRAATDSSWHESGFQQFAPVASCPDTIRVADIVIPNP